MVARQSHRRFTVIGVLDQMLSDSLVGLAAVARSAVAIFFLVAGVAKLVQPSSTAQAWGVLRLPRRYRSAAAVALALAEMTVGAVLVGLDGRVALIPPAIMLVIFTTFLTYLAYHREGTACGCLGDLGSASNLLGLMRNICLLGLLGVAAGTPAEVTPGAMLVGLQVTLLIIVLTEGLYVIMRIRTLRDTTHG